MSIYEHETLLVRVDYILVSASLVPAIRDATIMPAPSGYPGTDHVPIGLELAAT